MRNLVVFLAGVLLSCSAFALFSRATLGEPINVDSLEPVHRKKAAIQEEVRAKKFVLVNEKGTPIGTFGAFNGQPGLVLNDQDKKVRAVFALDKSGGPGLVLFDENGNPRAQVIMQEGDPRFVLFDGDRKVTFQVPQ